MKVEIDTDKLLEILRTGSRAAPGDSPYLQGRYDTTVHLARMIGIDLCRDIDIETFRNFIHPDRLFPHREDAKEAA